MLPQVRFLGLLLMLAAFLMAACRPAPTPVAEDITPATPTPTKTLSATLTPLPTPTATATPTPTHTPSPTPSPVAEPAQSDAATLSARAMAHLRWLSQTLGVRASTSPQEREAAEYISSQLSDFGYQAELQGFSVRTIQSIGRHLTVDAPDGGVFTVLVLAGSGLGEVNGPMVFVGVGREEDFPAEGLEGRVALVQRGEITFRRKVENAQQSGAVGVVIFNQVPELFRGTLVGSVDVPVVGISADDGEELLRLLEGGEVTVTLRVVRDERSSQNVVATINAGEGPVVVLGGHYDSVPESPGASDNGSGTAVALALAQELADRDLPFELRFVAFGSEELGLLGSRHYVDTLPENEQGRIVAMLNFDSLGAGVLEVLGDDQLVQQALDMAEELNIDAVSGRLPIGASSDHASFQEVGIPVVFFSGSNASRIHSTSDRIEFVDAQLLGEAALLGIRVIEYLAGSIG